MYIICVYLVMNLNGRRNLNLIYCLAFNYVLIKDNVARRPRVLWPTVPALTIAIYMYSFVNLQMSIKVYHLTKLAHVTISLSIVAYINCVFNSA